MLSIYITFAVDVALMAVDVASVVLKFKYGNKRTKRIYDLEDKTLKAHIVSGKGDKRIVVSGNHDMGLYIKLYPYKFEDDDMDSSDILIDDSDDDIVDDD